MNDLSRFSLRAALNPRDPSPIIEEAGAGCGARPLCPDASMFIIPLGIAATAREAPELVNRARAAAALGTDVIIDCTGTERCDATALQILLALRADLVAAGRA